MSYYMAFPFHISLFHGRHFIKKSTGVSHFVKECSVYKWTAVINVISYSSASSAPTCQNVVKPVQNVFFS